jgi:hypothetical protein
MLFSIIVSTIFLVVNHLYSGVNTIPGDQLCTQASQWDKRVCNTAAGDREWWDICRFTPNDDLYYWKDGICPIFTMCQNGWTDDEPRKMTISCVPVADNPYETTPGLQIGYSLIPAGSKQHNVSVEMRGNMADASVAGLLEGMLILTFQSLFN